MSAKLQDSMKNHDDSIKKLVFSKKALEREIYDALHHQNLHHLLKNLYIYTVKQQNLK